VLHAKGVLWVAVLVVLVIGVLLGGALETTPTPTRGPSTSRAERAAPTRLSIRPDLEKTPLAYQADYWEQLGRQALPHLVLIGPNRVAGIVVEPGLVLTSASAVEPMATRTVREPNVGDDATSDDDSADAPTADSNDPADTSRPSGPEEAAPPDEGRGGSPDGAPPGPGLVAVDWDDGLALYRLGDPATASTFAAADPTSFVPGSFAIAVTRKFDGGVQLTPGHVTDVTRSDGAIPDAMRMSLEMAEDTRAAAVVDLDGDLLGAAIRTERGVRVLAGGELSAAVARLKLGLPCYPIETSDLSDELLALLDVGNGVIIERIRDSAFLDDPSLEPGDVLIEWSEDPVSSVDQFLELYRSHAAGERVAHVVLRAGRRVRGASVVPDRHCRPLSADDALELTSIGLTLVWSDASEDAVGSASRSSAFSPAWVATQVSPGSPAATGDFMVGDRIVAVNSRPLAKGTARRTLTRLVEGRRAIVFGVRRDGRAKLLAVTPPDA